MHIISMPTNLLLTWHQKKTDLIQQASHPKTLVSDSQVDTPFISKYLSSLIFILILIIYFIF
jgi:hypothetical protein